MKKIVTPAVAIAGAALVGTLAATGITNASANPFAATGMTSGYMRLASSEGDDKCGGEKSEAEGKCGGEEANDEAESEKEKPTEGKCGEGKCGGDMKM